MRRNFTVFLAMLCSIAILQAQTLLTQDFTGVGSMPPSGWTIDAQAGNWSVKQTNTAGGTAPEARLSWSPQFNTTTRLISPVIDLTGISNLHVQMKHSIDHYSGAYTVGIATRSGSGAWTNAWTRAGANITEAIDVAITNNLGVSDFQICIFFSGSSYNMNYWYIDDITLYAPQDNDAALSAINVPTYVAADTTAITGKITNFGVSTITQIDLNWQVDGGDIQTSTISGLSVATGASYNFTSTHQWIATQGDKNLKVWISNLNGTGVDDDNSNDTLEKTIHVATQSVLRIPLFEEFTSSTCGPCASINSSTLNPFFNSHTGYTLLKYQMNWPISGDPYYTAEGGVRKTYYGVSSVPQMQTDGLSTNIQGGQGPVENMFNQRLASPAFMDITAYHTIDSVAKNVTLDIEIMPYFNGNNFTVYAAVFENVTHDNATTNGETSFKHVMMKMAPNANGTAATFYANTPFTLNLTTSLNGTHVEEYADLNIVVWVQNNENKEIFQSNYSDISTATAALSASPNSLSFGNVIHGQTSTIKSYMLTGNNLTADVAITTPAGYEISLDSSTFSSTQSITPDSGIVNQKIYVRFAPEAVQTYNGQILNATTGIIARSITVSGTGIAAPVAPLAAFYPVSGDTNVPIDTTFRITFTQPVRHLDNSAITAQTINSIIELKDAQNNNVAFTADISGNNQTITITPSISLQYNSNYTLYVSDVENEYDLSLADTSTAFRTQNNVRIMETANMLQFNVFPNPFKDVINIAFGNKNEVNKIEIYSITGRKMFEQNQISQNALQINTTNWNNGLYLIKMSINKQTHIKKVNLIR